MELSWTTQIVMFAYQSTHKIYIAIFPDGKDRQGSSKDYPAMFLLKGHKHL